MYYFETVMMVERLHRLFFDVIKSELDRQKIKDLNPMQCFILYDVGNNQLTVGEVSNRGYYLGSNATYNLKKMIENGYVLQEQSIHDRRSSHIKLSEKGFKIFNRFNEIFTQHSQNLKHNNVNEGELKEALATFSKLESFWRFSLNHSIPF